MAFPRHNGGSGLLDPAIQQLALFYRWVDPLLFETSNPSVVQQFLLVHLANQFQTANILLRLFFPIARPRSRSSLVTTIILACRTVDAIPRRQFSYVPGSLDAPACYYRLCL